MQAELISDGTSIELLDGERRRKVSPRSSHSIVQFLIAGIVQRCAGGRGIVGTEWDFRLGHIDGSVTLLVPDVAFLRFDRLAALPREERERPTIAPDVVAEVWSPSNDRPYVESKIRKYLACGTALVLDVDPRTRTIVAVDRDGSRTFMQADHFERAAIPWLVFPAADAFIGVEYFE